MSRFEELVRKLSITAAAEGKSVTVITHPASMDVSEKGAGSNLALAAMLTALNQPMPSFGALNLDQVKMSDKEEEPVM